MKKNRFVKFITFLVYVFLLCPLLIIVAESFSTDEFLKFPPKGFTLRWFQNVFYVNDFLITFKNSIEIAFIATLIALLIGIPVTYAMSRYRFRGKSILNGIFLSPVLVPGIVLGFVLLKYVVIEFNLPIFTSLIVGHTILVIPYVIRVVSSSLSNFDYAIEEAAMSLGAGRLYTFLHIVVPNIGSGVLASCILSFVTSFNNVPLSVFMTGPGVSTLPIKMLSYVEYHFDPTIAALSTLLMAITIVLMIIVEKTLGLRSIV